VWLQAHFSAGAEKGCARQTEEKDGIREKEKRIGCVAACQHLSSKRFAEDEQRQPDSHDLRLLPTCTHTTTL
jgi:hypothetical protein